MELLLWLCRRKFEVLELGISFKFCLHLDKVSMRGRCRTESYDIEPRRTFCILRIRALCDEILHHCFQLCFNNIDRTSWLDDITTQPLDGNQSSTAVAVCGGI